MRCIWKSRPPGWRKPIATLRTVRVDASTLLPPAERSKLLAEHARRSRDALIRDGRAAPTYQTFVDGREGASEDAVRPDGRILYVFSTLARAAAFAQAYLVGASPVLSGEFRRSWLLLVDGARWTRDPAAIPPGAIVHLVNTTPYARRLEVGRRRKPGLGFKLIERARQQMAKRYPELAIERRFLAWRDAYTLKAGQGRRKDRAAGQRITLPALEIKTRR
jgi:hypothetical protein